MGAEFNNVDFKKKTITLNKKALPGLELLLPYWFPARTLNDGLEKLVFSGSKVAVSILRNELEQAFEEKLVYFDSFPLLKCEVFYRPLFYVLFRAQLFV